MSNPHPIGAFVSDIPGWYILSDGEFSGPFSMHQLVEKARVGEIVPSDLVQNANGLCRKFSKASAFTFLQVELAKQVTTKTSPPIATPNSEKAPVTPNLIPSILKQLRERARADQNELRKAANRVEDLQRSMAAEEVEKQSPDAPKNPAPVTQSLTDTAVEVELVKPPFAPPNDEGRTEKLNADAPRASTLASKPSDEELDRYYKFVGTVAICIVLGVCLIGYLGAKFGGNAGSKANGPAAKHIAPIQTTPPGFNSTYYTPQNFNSSNSVTPSGWQSPQRYSHETVQPINAPTSFANPPHTYDAVAPLSSYPDRYYDYNYRPPVGEHYVSPHVRRDGTFVQGHFRTNPDDSFWNNWSAKGNINPHTGKMGTHTPAGFRTGRR